ncbi:uncharacterized protein [Asterias amurensis]|uniref:uncharacterized protein n=1 Tax=Asterias amurensis TaxID=7602 RepID=UPI003AB57413
MSVLSNQLELRCIVIVSLLCFHAVRAITINRTVEINTKEVDSIVLHCPVDTPSGHHDEAHLVIQWITPKFMFVSETSIDKDSGMFIGDHRLKITSNGSLVIQPLCYPDFGDYQCIVYRSSTNGTRLFISDATVSLKLHEDLANEFNCNLTVFADSSNNYITTTVGIVLFISGAIFGIVSVFCVYCTVQRCKLMFYRKTVARLRKGSVHELSARAGSVKSQVKKNSTHTNVAPEDPKEAFVMYTNPLQDEPDFHGYMADPFPPSPPPRLQTQNSSLAVSQEFRITPGLAYAIHASSLQELHTTGCDDPRDRPHTWNPKNRLKIIDTHPMGVKKDRAHDSPNAKNIQKNHISTSSSVKTPTSSCDYENITFEHPSLVVESEDMYEDSKSKSSDPYLMPLKIHRSLVDFPLPPPPLTSSECLGADSCSHASLPLPPLPLDNDTCDPHIINTASKGCILTLQNTWPKRVSSKRRYHSISGLEQPDYLEIIASADCIHLNSN